MSAAEKAIKAAEFIVAATKDFDENEFVATICTAMNNRTEMTGEDLLRQVRKLSVAIHKNQKK